MKTKAGLWIDHRQAIVVIVSDTGEVIKQIQITADREFYRSSQYDLR